MKKRILFLAANPVGTTKHKLDEEARVMFDEEARAILDELQRASLRDTFELVTRLAARPIDVLRALREVKPTIVHFSGHADAASIYLTRDDGTPALVTREALVTTFGAAGESVQIVVMNQCVTDDLAEALCEFVPVSVGTTAFVGDRGARMFSVGFYGALASGSSATQALSHGKAAMHLETTGDHDGPRLHHRTDVNPGLFIVASDESSAVRAMIEAYRTRKADSFERWDLRTAGPQPMVGKLPLEITLDDMYIPLRFDAKLDSTGLERGKHISPEALLRPQRAQVLVGGAGSGKTTWMRWTFRRLIKKLHAVPFFLELRAIAAAWKAPHDAGRAIDSYLADELTACEIPGASSVVAALLADASGPQPVILIDGWDELGAQGERVRERLVEFCNAFPHVVVVVSSRPYGDTRPASVKRFQTLYIQPLSDHDVRLLATHFHRCVHGLDESAGIRATNEFMAALAAAPDARSLAGTALLLTMILLLSREGPLPDRRHKLYTSCLRNMLLHRVTRREREGAVLDDDQWRPEDSEERLRVVAELAYKMQSTGYESADRAPIIRGWVDAVALLKAEWTADQRDRYLRWLVASAGVLVDRTDGSVHFAHLSFQEHLAAYYLFITLEGDERVTAVRERIAKRDWWETLRLWAGLTSDHWPDKLRPVLKMLHADREGYWLAGEIFADGTGPEVEFEAWAAELVTRLSNPFGSGDDCARAWGVCKQSDRRAVLTAKLSSAREGLHWIAGTWHAYWSSLANLEVEPAPALQALEAPIDDPHAVARSRVLFGAVASWPDGGELAVLRLWPSARMTVGARLQTAISLGASESELVVAFRELLGRSHPGQELMFPKGAVGRLDQYFVQYLSREFTGDSVRNLDQYFAWYFARRFDQDFGREFAREFGRDFRRDFVRKAARVFLREFEWEYVRDHAWDIARHFARQFGGDFIQYFITRFGKYFVQKFDRDFVRGFVRDFARRFDRDLGGSGPLPNAPWVPTFAVLEAGSIVGRAAPRAVLAYGDVPHEVPLLKLFRRACKASFQPGWKLLGDAVIQGCEEFHGDPLWPALARHIARISTLVDRAFLIDLAAGRERRSGRLSWGLQHYVRGDLVLDNNDVVTLDQLCDKAGLEPLPFLEDMPDELDIPLGDVAP